MEKTFCQTIEKYNLIKEHEHILIGFSGGADSLALLHLLKKYADNYKIYLTAVHIHHGIRGVEADNDADFCRQICSDLGIDFIIQYFDIKKEAKIHKLTEEEAGRKIRYDCFYSILKKLNANKIAVAHNQNDQAETMLMRFFRGTGIKGLSGIPIKRKEIIRPLLYTSRCEIEKYCKENDLPYRTDQTNEETKYTRNSIRNILLPQIKSDYNKNIIATLSRSAEIIREENDFLDRLCNQICTEIIKEKKEKTMISIEELKKHDIVLQRRIIRQAYLKYSIDLHDISLSHINIILELLEKESGKEVSLPQTLKASVQYGHLCLYKDLPKKLPFEYQLELDREIIIAELNLKIIISIKNDKLDGDAYTKAFDYDKISNNLKLRNRRTGDKILLSAAQGSKKLKDYFIDEKVPRADRDDIPLLADGQSILWVVGQRVSDFYAVTKDTKQILYVFLKN